MFRRVWHDGVFRRLLPLYISRFFGGIVLWYAIEKIYMTSIGFDATLIGVSAAVLSIGILLFEVPLGILADKWSRKGVMVLGEISLIVGSIGFGLSESIIPYVLCSLFYAFYISSNSGAVDSVVYDTLLEENGSRKGFEKYYGWLQFAQGVGLVLAGFASMLVLSFDTVRSTYFWSLVPLGFSLGLLLLLREPRLHKQGDIEKILHQFKGTLKILLLNSHMLRVLGFMVVAMVLLEVIYEMDQLWPLALAMPLIWYGPLNSLLLLGSAVSGPLAGKIAEKKVWFLLSLGLILPCLAVLQIKNMIVIGVAFFVGVTIYNAFYIYGQGVIHDNVSSRRRTSASSLASMLSSVAILPTIIGFGLLVDEFGVFRASVWLLPVGLLLFCLGFSFKHRTVKQEVL